MTEPTEAATAEGAWARLRGTLSHSTFWLALCSIVLNLVPYYFEIAADSPIAMRWIRIVASTAWVIYLYLAGKLPAPAPPGLLATKK